MKHIKHLLLPLAAIGLAACEIETSGNGTLDGFWHLERADTLATGGSTDLTGTGRFWAFQSRLLNVTNGESSFMLRFSHEGDSLFLSDPYEDDRTNSDPKLEIAEPLNPYGINSLTERFRIERLKGGDLVVSSKTLRLKFKKF